MRSIRRVDAVEPVVHRLAEAKHPSTGQPIFQFYRDLALFAALIGYETDTRVKVEGECKELVEGRVFGRDDLAIDLLCLVALAATQDVEILRPENEDKAMDVFESFVNGGLRILGDWLKETPEDPNGDRALLSALYKYKFLNGDHAEDTLDNVSF